MNRSPFQNGMVFCTAIFSENHLPIEHQWFIAVILALECFLNSPFHNGKENLIQKQTKMETKIQKVLKQSFPDFLALSEVQASNYATYQILEAILAKSVKLIEENNNKKLKEVFEVLDNLYQYGSRYDKNAIENEFLMGLSNIENPISFKEHLKQMPKTLREAYLKSIIEN
jgi:hypothetical protein